jgi:hypothetical protein
MLEQQTSIQERQRDKENLAKEPEGTDSERRWTTSEETRGEWPIFGTQRGTKGGIE